MKEIFDFFKLKQLFSRKDFKFVIDGMHGVAGPYAKTIFGKEFGKYLKLKNYYLILIS
jgi:phosphoglucomutase